MKASTKRAIRTAYQLVVALATFVPLVVLLVPVEFTPAAVAAALPALVAWAAFVTKVVNAAEDAGLIPAWLRDDAPPRPRRARREAPSIHDVEYADEP